MDLYPSLELKPFPKFSRPEICGAFSVDSNLRFQHGMEHLKYLSIPRKVDFDLNNGDENYVEKPDVDNKINHLLTFMTEHEDLLRSNQFNFVCFRGLLRMIMCTPYEYRETWIILATKFKGTVYLCAQETPEKKDEKLRRTDRDKRFMRYGHKFENYVFSSHPNGDAPGSNKQVVEAEEFCTMFNTKIGGMCVLYGAEIDGVISKEIVTTLPELKKVPLVEVKVKRRESNERQLHSFYKNKARNFWCQSFLVGIDKVFVGLRNDNGIVNEVTSYTLKELSDQAKQKNYWHGTVCMNFLNDFLRKVMLDMKDIDDPYTVFKYQWDASKCDYVSCQKICDKSFSFLTNEFIQFMNNLC